MLRKLVILIALLIGSSCNNVNPETFSVYIFVDITDGVVDLESTIENDLKQLANFTNISEVNGGNNGIELKIFEINNLSESVSKTFVLNAGVPGMLGQNPLDRRDEIEEFNKKVKEALISIQNDEQKALNQSKIYQNLCRKFDGLDFNSNETLIIIYSDMLENSELFSFYKNRRRISDWEKNIDTALDYLESEDCAFPNLENSKIHIISKRKIENDELINRAQTFWSNFFNLKGAEVKFDSELNLN